MRHRLAFMGFGLLLASHLGPGVADAAVALPDAVRARSSSERNAVATLIFRIQSASVAEAQRGDAITRGLRRQVELRDGALSANRVALSAARAQGVRSAQQARQLALENDRLEREAGEAKEIYATALAERDRDFAREREILMAAAQSMLASEEGRRALDLINAQNTEGRVEASQILDRLYRARRALDARQLATLYLNIQGEGLATTDRIMALFEEAVRHDPGNAGDWLALARLYVNLDRTRAANAAANALRLTGNDVERAGVYLVQAGIAASGGDFAAASASYERSLALYRSNAAAEPTQANRITLASILSSAGGYQERRPALEKCREGERLVRDLIRENPSSQYAPQLARSLDCVAVTQFDLGDPRAALISSREALSLRESVTAPSPLARLDLAGNHGGLSEIYTQLGDLRAALSEVEQSLAIRREVARTDPALGSDAMLAWSIQGVADAHARLGQTDRAARLYEEATAIRRGVAAHDPTSANRRRDLAVGLTMAANMYLQMRDREGARTRYDEAGRLYQQNVRENPLNRSYRRDLLLHTQRMGGMAEQERDGQGALRHYQQSLILARELAADASAGPQSAGDLAVAAGRIGDMLEAGGDREGAIRALAEPIALLRESVERAPRHAPSRRVLAALLMRLARLGAPGYSWAMVAAQYEALRTAGLFDAEDAPFAAEAELRARQE